MKMFCEVKVQEGSTCYFLAQWRKIPGVVLEVAYSNQQELDLIAEDYLLKSRGNIQVAVGLDIDYGKEARKAIVLIWRLGTTRIAMNKKKWKKLSIRYVVFYTNFFKHLPAIP